MEDAFQGQTMLYRAPERSMVGLFGGSNIVCVMQRFAIDNKAQLLSKGGYS